MKIDFQYGSEGLEIELPDEWKVDVIRPREETPLDNPSETVYKLCKKPLNSKPLDLLLRKKRPENIVVVIEDHTRPVPTYAILRGLDKLFSECGVPDENINLLVATGLHRAPTPSELERMVGREFIERFDIISHNAEDYSRLKYVGTTGFGTEVYLNSYYLDADFRITTGYVEPHFFAGISGGRKILIPGIAGKETILSNHRAEHCDSPRARFGILKGNPIHEDAVEGARFARPEFCVNVCIDGKNHRITKVGAGNIFSVHNTLADYIGRVCFVDIQHPYDIVVCGNGGYPLDLNLYQAVKSMAIGELAAKKGGVIVAVNECRDGVGQEKFEELINSGKTPAELYGEIMEGKIRIPDTWEIQILSRILMNYNVFTVSSIPEDKLGNIGLRYAENVKNAIEKGADILGKKPGDCTILVLPEGPAVLPRIR